MPARTVTLGIVAVTELANRQIQATGRYFDDLRAKNPVELQVKLNRAQAIAESKIIAKEMSQTVRDTIKLQTEYPASQSIFKLLGGAFSGGGGAGKGGGGIAGAFGALPPQLQAGGVAAGLAALPLLAQAAAGAITFGLGSALAGLGVYGAVASASVGKVTVTALQLAAAQERVAGAQDKLAAAQKSGKDNTGQLDRAYAGLASAQDHLAKVQAAWADQQLPAAVAKMHQAFGTLSSDAQDSLRKIGAPFVPVLTLIAKTADTVLKDLTPAFVSAEKVIAPVFSGLATTLIKAFGGTAFQQSIAALASAFSKMLGALTPQIPGDINAIANGFTALFKSASSPQALKAMSDFVFFLAHAAAGALQVIAALSNVAGWIEKNWKWDQWFLVPEEALISWSVKNLVPFLTRTLPDAFKGIVITALKVADGIAGAFALLPGPLGSPFKAAKAAIDKELGLLDGDVGRTASNIKTQWALLNGLTAYLNVVVNSPINPGPGGSTSTNPATRRYAGGTGWASPGWAWVGEKGAELVHFGGGETVLPASVSRGYAGGAGYGGAGRVEALLEEQNDLLAQLIGVSAAAPARTGAVMGAALASSASAATYAQLYS